MATTSNEGETVILQDNRAFAARTAARFLRDGRLENCVNKQFLLPKA